LGCLISHRAQANVRAWFRQEFFEVDKAHGRATLEKEVARAGASAVALEKIAVHLAHKELDEFCAAIGRNEITVHQIEVAIRELVAPPIKINEEPLFTGVSKHFPGFQFE
jgi:GTP pyrophosphokinase